MSLRFLRLKIQKSRNDEGMRHVAARDVKFDLGFGPQGIGTI
jgi:hypothetical protein